VVRNSRNRAGPSVLGSLEEKPGTRNTAGTPWRTNEYWSLRTNSVCSGIGSGISFRPASAAARAATSPTVECSLPNATTVSIGNSSSGMSMLTLAIGRPIAAGGLAAK
jgi:hypothetical protein